MESVIEKISVGLGIITGVLLFYATFPAIQASITPSAPLLWEPVLSAGQALSVIGAVVGIGVLLAVVNRLRLARATGTPVVPVAFWVILFGVVAAALVAFVAVFIFEFTYQSMLSLGVSSSIAILVGLAVSVITWFVLIRR